MGAFNHSCSEKLCRIQAYQSAESLPGAELFPTLEQLLSMRFIGNDRHGIAVAGEIGFQAPWNNNVGVSSGSIPSLSVPLPAGPADDGQQLEIEVKFADDPDVPIPFRGRMVTTRVAGGGRFRPLRGNGKVLATSKQGPIWSVSETGPVKHFRSALPLPYISSERNFSDVFNGERFLEMLVLLQFLREISGNTTYKNAPLRAGFIIDDPNLHWPRYGFVNYREIAVHARKENYHVSFATIPLDTWFTHAATADLFRRNSRSLSL